MSLLPRQRVGMLILVGYTVSTVICACPAAMTTAKPAAHACCQDNSRRAPLSAPARQSHSKHCMHCGDGGLAIIAQKDHHQADRGCATLTIALTALPATPCPRCVARRDLLQGRFPPSATLLELHCALTT